MYVSLQTYRENFLEKLELSCMRELTVERPEFLYHLSAHLIQITSLQLHRIYLSDRDLELDWFTSLLGLGLYRCEGVSSILPKSKNPKLKDFRIELEPVWSYYGYRQAYGKDFKEQISSVRRLQGLETLVIEVPDQKHPANLLENLTDSISLEHNDTLRYLSLLNVCKPEDGDTRPVETTNSMNSIRNAILTCTHLVQLDFPTEWGTKEDDFKVLYLYLKPTTIGNN